MHDENKSLLKELATLDFVVALVLGLVTYFIFHKACLFFILGIIIAYLNLFINTVVLNKIIISGQSPSKSILILSQILRIAIVTILSFIIVRVSIINFFIFILGYGSQVISLILYGKINKE